MTTLRVTQLTLPAADWGTENPLAPLAPVADEPAPFQFGDGVPDEIRRQTGTGRHAGCLPYRPQDGYNRERHPREFRVAVLQNDVLCATFLLELGGRMVSLVHRPTQRELLAVNPVFQPANLAVRNAWFSGGVEWNIGVIGHSPLTCSPLHAERLDAPDGTPVLRLREWERIRQIPFQIDFWLPEASPVLYARVSIRNPSREEVPMYWWSNIAVPETPGTRVLAPADHAFRFDHHRRMERVPLPHWRGMDISYPTAIDRAADFFFDVPDDQRPWIAAVGSDGCGLVQTSTRRLRGRKLFVWGMAPGGRHWQSFLTDGGPPYIELQAGLARTQAECLPMPPGAEWNWTEAYGLLTVPPADVHGVEWAAACRQAEQRLNKLLPLTTLARQAAIGDGIAARPAGARVQVGSGWGGLEARRLERTKALASMPGRAFANDPLGPDQAPWLQLLEHGTFPALPPEAPPGCWMVQREWRTLLEAALLSGGADHWLGWLHAGVMRHAAGDRAGAAQAWTRSLKHARTAWALRNLAVLARQENRPDEAIGLLDEACALAPAVLPLGIEWGTVLLEAHRPGDWLVRAARLAPAVRAHGRIRLLVARGHLARNELDAAEAILLAPLEICDIREGETILSDTWFALAARRLALETGLPVDDALRTRARQTYPLPPHLDFRGGA
ncbi:MAG: DUF5107 domain-containing protein [Lentisphaerae bacterium]|nr:DUF5107 domain-containing protein [Lentisphaerota bacterium]